MATMYLADNFNHERKMKLWIQATLLVELVACGVPTATNAQEAEEIFPFETRRFDLENGLRVYLVHAGAPDQLAYVSIVRAGARDEVEPGRTGFAHFFEHVMFRGTNEYPNYDAVTEAMGASRNGTTNQDRTFYYIVAASSYLDNIVDLESDRFMNLSYDEAAFRTEAGAVLGEYQNSAYAAGSVLDRAVRETVFTRHTYRHQTIGFEADVRAMPEGYRYSLGFYDRLYRPENVVILVVGDFDFDGAERSIRQHYSAWEQGYEAPDVPREPRQTAPRVAPATYAGRTLPLLTVNYMAPAWSAADRTAVATELLGRAAFGPTSDIYRRLVLEERRVQTLSARFGLSRDPDFVQIYAQVADPEDVEAVRDELLAEAARFRADLVDGAVLEKVKSNARYGFLMGLETALDVASSVSRVIVDTGELEPVNEYYRTLASLTPEDLREAARRVLVESGRTIVTLRQAGDGS